MSSDNSNLGDSKAIISNQEGLHEKLTEVVQRHLSHEFQKPIQAHTQQAFDEVNAHVQAFSGDIILDACCGVGQSTRILAKQNPDALVIGVDKSAHRINRNVEDHWQADNFHLVRADLNDFYRLVHLAKWPVTKHYVLYPNPWPKSKHLQRRWHGSAVFPQMIKIGQQMILRSNWPLYLQEFLAAIKLTGADGAISEIPNISKGDSPLTPFEAKYLASGQKCWQLTITLPENSG